MVLIFIPKGNDSDPCFGVSEYNSHRPSYSAEIHQANLGFFIFFVIIDMFSIGVAWILRDTPRFRKVRPFILTALFCFAQSLYFVGANLSVLDHFPCWLMIFSYSIALSFMALLVSMRALVVLFETQFSRLARKETQAFDDDIDESYISDETNVNFLSILLVLVNLLFGFRKPASLTFAEISYFHDSYSPISAIFLIPGFVCFIVVIITVPEYRLCDNCDAFLELPISQFVLLSFYVSIAVRYVFLAYKIAGIDSKGVIIELFSIPLFVGAFAFTGWTLIIIDPEGKNLNREFTWPILFNLGGLIYWFLVVGYQVIYQINHFKSRKQVVRSMKIEDRKTVLLANPALKLEFQEFATKRYVIESVTFLNDVETFKEMFREKSESWRVLKFKQLCKKYIVAGSAMEINISGTARAVLTRKFQNVPTGSQEIFLLETAFDDAVKEVDKMVKDGIWTEFWVRRAAAERKKMSANKTFSIVLSSQDLVSSVKVSHE